MVLYNNNRKVLENIFANCTDPSLQYWDVDSAYNAFSKDKTASLNEVRMHVKILSESYHLLGQDTSGVISNSKDEANNQLAVTDTHFSLGQCHKQEGCFADVILEKKIKDKIDVELVAVRAQDGGDLQEVDHISQVRTPTVSFP